MRIPDSRFNRSFYFILFGERKREREEKRRLTGAVSFDVSFNAVAGFYDDEIFAEEGSTPFGSLLLAKEERQ